MLYHTITHLQAVERDFKGLRIGGNMAHKIVAIQVDYKGADTKVTALGQSPRGTRYQLKEVQVDVPREDESAFAKAVADAITSL